MAKRLVLLLLLFSLSLSAASDEKFQVPAPVTLTRDGEKWADKTLKKLSLEEKVGQLFMVRGYAEFENLNSPEYIELRDSIHKYHLGSILITVRVDGPFLLRNQPYEAAMMTNQLQRESPLPLIFAADFERGPSMRLNSVTQFPHAMAFGAAGSTDLAEQFGRISAAESRAIGVQWNFFPIADANSNPANPIINTRSFGEDPQRVGELAAAYIRGAHQSGMLTTAKHFPGHGDTDTDSHLELARVGGDRQRLDSIELPPFRRAFEAGVDSVMVAHVTVPALESDPNRVATTSPAIITKLLKEEMGFKGLIVTDAMDMRALTRLYSDGRPVGGAAGRAAVEALKAGNDMILLPSDLDGAYNGIIEAVRTGVIPEAQIDASVRKVLRAKAAVGLHKARFVDLGTIASVIATPQSLAVAQQIADSAITLVRDNGKLLPLKKRGTPPPQLAYGNMSEAHDRVVAVVISDDVRSESGRRFERELRNRIPDARLFFIDGRSAAGRSADVLQAVQQADNVIVAAYVVPVAGKAVKLGEKVGNTVSLAQSTGDLLRQLLEQARAKTVVVAMGNPYLAGSFPDVENYLCTFSNVPISEYAAVRALFGEIPIHGKLPVTLPGIAERGAGIDRPANVSYRTSPAQHHHAGAN